MYFISVGVVTIRKILWLHWTQTIIICMEKKYEVYFWFHERTRSRSQSSLCWVSVQASGLVSAFFGYNYHNFRICYFIFSREAPSMIYVMHAMKVYLMRNVLTVSLTDSLTLSFIRLCFAFGLLLAKAWPRSTQVSPRQIIKRSLPADCVSGGWGTAAGWEG